MAEDLPQRDPVVGPLAVAVPGVPVAPADPAGLDVDDDPVARRFGVVYLLDVERFAVLGEDCGAHGRISRGWGKSSQVAGSVEIREAGLRVVRFGLGGVLGFRLVDVVRFVTLVRVVGERVVVRSGRALERAL